jgi:uncharacterized Zn-binding protein involved in type VI secretion
VDFSSEINMSRPVARVGDFIFPHVCPIGEPHSTPMITGSLNVLTNGKPTVRFGDLSVCGVMAIPTGTGVMVNGKPLALMGTPTTKHVPTTIVNGVPAVSATTSVVGGQTITEVTFIDCFPPTFIAMGSTSVLANTGGL